MKIESDIKLTPEQVADAFWSLDDRSMVAFFAHLHRIAGTRLDFQLGAALRQLSDGSSPDAVAGMGVMHDYTEGLIEFLTDVRSDSAKRVIGQMASAAQLTHHTPASA